MTHPTTGCGASIGLPFELTPQALDEFDGTVMQHILSDTAAIAIDCSGLNHISAAQIALLLRACHMAKHGGAAVALPGASVGLIRVLRAVEVHDYFDAEVSGWPQDHLTTEPCELRGQVLTHDFTLASEPIDCAASKLSSFLCRAGGDEAHTFEWNTIFHEWIALLQAISELDSSKQVNLIASTSSECMSVSIMDPGEPLNLCDRITNVEFREAIEAQNRPAMCMALVQRLVDSITYERSNETNAHTLEKCLFRSQETES